MKVNINNLYTLTVQTQWIIL